MHFWVHKLVTWHTTTCPYQPGVHFMLTCHANVACIFVFNLSSHLFSLLITGITWLCLDPIFFGFWHCNIFVFIWQILSNHRVTRLKKFVSRFTDKLFLFSLIFNVLCMCRKIWCDVKSFRWSKHGPGATAALSGRQSGASTIAGGAGS
jgi:hypothetical protein